VYARYNNALNFDSLRSRISAKVMLLKL
jgi:hypothetical protein